MKVFIVSVVSLVCGLLLGLFGSLLLGKSATPLNISRHVDGSFVVSTQIDSSKANKRVLVQGDSAMVLTDDISWVGMHEGIVYVRSKGRLFQLDMNLAQTIASTKLIEKIPLETATLMKLSGDKPFDILE